MITETPEVIAAHDELVLRVAGAAASRFPGLTFGYIGNCGVYRSGPYDDRSWRIFLPHPGRVGGWDDWVGSYETAQLPQMLADWDKLVARLERAWSAGARS
jgi:hypothetical protein